MAIQQAHSMCVRELGLQVGNKENCISFRGIGVPFCGDAQTICGDCASHFPVLQLATAYGSLLQTFGLQQVVSAGHQCRQPSRSCTISTQPHCSESHVQTDAITIKQDYTGNNNQKLECRSRLSIMMILKELRFVGSGIS